MLSQVLVALVIATAPSAEADPHRGIKAGIGIHADLSLDKDERNDTSFQLQGRQRLTVPLRFDAITLELGFSRSKTAGDDPLTTVSPTPPRTRETVDLGLAYPILSRPQSAWFVVGRAGLHIGSDWYGYSANTQSYVTLQAGLGYEYFFTPSLSLGCEVFGRFDKMFRHEKQYVQAEGLNLDQISNPNLTSGELTNNYGAGMRGLLRWYFLHDDSYRDAKAQRNHDQTPR